MFMMTMAQAQPLLAHQFRSCQPDNFRNDMCFEILGMDVLLDFQLNPWLIEINHTPSFNIDSPFDNKLKNDLLTDTF
jgi:tubulin polyglutamylase TTLL6/13